MSKQSKTGILIILGALIAISPFSIDMYLPAFPFIARDLKTDMAHVGYTLTSYYAGLCVGQLFYGILIDRFGRKKPLITGLLIYIIAAVACAVSPGITWLISVRLLLALGGCVGMVASRAMVRDLYPPEDIAKILSLLMLVMGLAPIIAPTIGGLISQLAGWRFVFGMMGILAAILGLSVFFILPETKLPDASVSLKAKEIIPEYQKVLKNFSFVGYTIAGGIGYAGMYAYIAGSPFVFMQKFGLTQSQYGWAFALNAAGLIAGSQLNRVVLKKYDSSLVSIIAAIVLFITGLGLLGLTAAGSISAVGTLVFTFFFLFCLGFINPNTTALALKPFTAAAGRASAVLGSIQMLAGVLASGLVSYFFNGTAIPMPAVMFGCSAICLVLLSITHFRKKQVPVLAKA